MAPPSPPKTLTMAQMPGSVSTANCERSFGRSAFAAAQQSTLYGGGPVTSGMASSLAAASFTCAGEGFPRRPASSLALSAVNSNTLRLALRKLMPRGSARRPSSATGFTPRSAAVPFTPACFMKKPYIASRFSWKNPWLRGPTKYSAESGLPSRACTRRTSS